jgi:hypothetical protein
VWEPSTDPVTLEIQRVGDTVTESFGPVGGPLTVFYTDSSPEFLGAAGFDLYLFDAGSTQAASVAYSDFTVTYDTSATPEPAACFSLLRG